MRKHLLLLLAATSSLCVLLIPQPSLGDEIPKIAWRRPLGQPLENPGVRKNKSDIDDGYWQGAADLVLAPSLAPIAATSHGGISRAASTNTFPCLPTNSPCFSKLPATPPVLRACS